MGNYFCLNEEPLIHTQRNKKINALYERKMILLVGCVFCYALFYARIMRSRIRGPPVLVWDFLISNQKTGGFYNEKI